MPQRIPGFHPDDQTGLFAVAVVTLLAVSFPLLQPDLTDTSNWLLTQIAQQSSPNGTSSSQPLSPDNESPFRSHASALRVNVVWLISLSLSTVCALLTTLVQQWARNSTQAADKPDSALGFMLFLVGVEKIVLPVGKNDSPTLALVCSSIFLEDSPTFSPTLISSSAVL